MNKKDLALFVLLILMGMFCFIAGYGFHNIEHYKNIQNLSECSDLDLKETAYCQASYIKSFYNYTVREDTEKTLEDLKLNGGDCYDYNKLHERLANKTYNGISYAFYHSKENNTIKGHRFSVIYDKTGYCILDQTNVVGCLMFETEE